MEMFIFKVCRRIKPEMTQKHNFTQQYVSFVAVQK